MTEPSDPRSLPQLLASLTGDLSSLVRGEAQLVRAELNEKLGHLGKAAGELAAAAICLLAALMVLLQALVIALGKVMDPAWAALLVGVVVAIGGVVLLRIGTNTAKPANLTPDRALRQAGKDATFVKDQLK